MRKTIEELKWRRFKYEQWRRRFFRQHVRLLKESRDAALIYQINNSLLNGIGSSEQIRQLIAYLIGEYGEGFLNSECLRFFLKKEESDYEHEDEDIDYLEYSKAFPENEEYRKLANLQLLNK